MDDRISILLKNEDFIVVNKYGGVLSVPSSGDDKTPHIKEIARHVIPDNFYPVNRIDKMASGIVIFAREGTPYTTFSNLFAKRRIEKKYMGVVHGIVQEDGFIIERRLIKTSTKTKVSPMGKKYIVEVRVIRRFIAHTMVEVIAKTGIRHQVRVMLGSAGHPIVGDTLYGISSKEDIRHHFMFLHFGYVSFEYEGQKYEISAPLPAYFEKFLRKLEKETNKIASLFTK